ncbi:hypothetical protein IFM89_029405 [Coptis chinensis]|uniref:NADH dehydrogenase [ubiquinone] iron-sulfur protein 4, mitochondrial n=1 Tax=Coptis chinensis TaxID=261450 RepID=A0A835MFR2_9MAGN|nr:hypothetical protein IFM89_029405 [Coptis chinensis]
MGWTSTGDPYANVGDSALDFDSEESAKAFANNHEWDYVFLRSSEHVVLGLILAASHCQTFSLIHGYSAPLEAYMHLEHHEDVGVGEHDLTSSHDGFVKISNDLMNRNSEAADRTGDDVHLQKSQMVFVP